MNRQIQSNTLFIVIINIYILLPNICSAQSTLFTEDANDTVSAAHNRIQTPSPGSIIQNAILEGIQLTAEPADVMDETIISCYFIFRDKPTSYFYEMNKKEKIIIFEFNDVVLGASPIPGTSLSPIKRFRIKEEKINVNEDVIGLTPEYHDAVRVFFYYENLPYISVKDEYSVISYSFRWSKNPGKNEQFIQVSKNSNTFMYSIIGGGIVLGGAGAYFLFSNKSNDLKIQPLTPIQGEIVHPDPQKP